MANRWHGLQVRGHGRHVGVGSLAKVRKGHRRSDGAPVWSLSFANRGGDLAFCPAADSRLRVGRDVCPHPTTKDRIVEAIATREMHPRKVHLPTLVELLRRVAVSADADGLHKIAAALEPIRAGLRRSRQCPCRDHNCSCAQSRHVAKPTPRSAESSHRTSLAGCLAWIQWPFRLRECLGDGGHLARSACNLDSHGARVCALAHDAERTALCLSAPSTVSLWRCCPRTGIY